MKNTKLGAPLSGALVPCLLCLLYFANACSAAQTFLYHEQTGEEGFTYVWRAEQGSGKVTITQDQGDKVYSSICTPDGTTLSWHYTSQPDTDIRAERIGNRIHFKGKFAGKEIDRDQAIDPRPWFQPLSFSLQTMLADDQHSVRFWTIRPDTLEVVAMKAEQSGRAQIALANASSQQARKVVIRLDGLLSALWHAEYWFRQSDHVFVHYQGIHGPPGTAATKISLIGQ